MKRKTKKRIRNIVIIFISICTALFVLKGSLYRTAISYKDDGSRKNYKIRDKTLAIFIEDKIPANQTSDIESVIDLAQQIAADALEFQIDIKDADPSKTVLLKRANCIGYAAFTAATGNYLIDKYNLSKIWEARPVKGKLYIFGYDMHKQTKNKNFKDHDFVIFTNKITKREICIDPSLYDYAGIKRIRKF